MKMSNPRKMNFRTAVTAAGIVLATAALPACTAFGPLVAPGDPDNRIVAGCIWPGSANRYTYFSAKGDTVQVEAGREHAHFQALIDNGNANVSGSYDAHPYSIYNPNIPNQFMGLTIHNVTSNSGSYAPPSMDKLLHGAYPFAEAVHLAQYAAYDDPAQRPTTFCSPDMAIDGGIHRPILHGIPGIYGQPR